MIYPLFLILLCIAIPAYFIYFKKNHFAAVTWLTLTVVLDIFNSAYYMNLPGAILFGIVALPYVWTRRLQLWENKAVRVFALYLGFLILVGTYHGFIAPWPDLTGIRSIKDQAQMRTILHLGRTGCEWLVILYLVLQFENEPKRIFNRFVNSAFVAGLILLVSPYLERFFEFDFHHYFTGGGKFLYPPRPRGFGYEPRGLSQNLAYAILLTPFSTFGKWRYALIPAFFFTAFFYTMSFTGLLVLVFGALLLLASNFWFQGSVSSLFRKKPIAIFGITVAAIAATAILAPKPVVNHISDRAQHMYSGSVLNKFEVFDAASLNFLTHHPQYAIAGTGAGTIYLPASEYVIERDLPDWRNKFEALPHMGAVLTLSNTGLIGLLILLFGFSVALREKRLLSTPTSLRMTLVGIALAGLYFLQIRYYFLFGFAALIARDYKERERAIKA